MIFHEKKKIFTRFCLTCLENNLKFEFEIFPRAQPCSPLIIGSMIHNMLLLNVEVHFLRTLVKGMQILVNYPYS